MTQDRAATDAQLAELIAGRRVIRWSEISKFPHARERLNVLIKEGSLIRVQHGVYFASAGKDRQGSADFEPSEILSSNQLNLLELLGRQRTAKKLAELTGVTRQAINKSLQNLIHRGLVQRRIWPSEKRTWQYARSDVTIKEPVRRRDLLSAKEAIVLNSLPSDGPGLLSDVRKMLPNYSLYLKGLVDRGLVEQSCKTTPKVVRLTQAGATHVQYRSNVPKLKSVNEAALLRSEKLALLIALSNLTTASGRKLETASGVKRGKNVYVPQLLGEMKRSGWIKQITVPGARPSYTLTARGQELVGKVQQARRNAG